MFFVVIGKFFDVERTRFFVSDRVDIYYELFCSCFFKHSIDRLDNKCVHNTLVITEYIYIKLSELSVATFLRIVMTKNRTRVIEHQWLWFALHTVLDICTHETCSVFWAKCEMITTFCFEGVHFFVDNVCPYTYSTSKCIFKFKNRCLYW